MPSQLTITAALTTGRVPRLRRATDPIVGRVPSLTSFTAWTCSAETSGPTKTSAVIERSSDSTVLSDRAVDGPVPVIASTTN